MLMQKPPTPSFKTVFKEHLITALTLAPALSVLILSAVYQGIVRLSGYEVSFGAPLILGWLTVLSLLASTVLAVVLRRRFTTLFFSVLFTLCFIFSALFYANGTTDLLSDSFFEAIMLVFTLPSYAYMSVSSSLSSVPAIPSLILTGMLMLANIGATVFLFYEGRHRE